MVALKYLSHFLRSLSIHLINCEISPQLKWLKNCILEAGAVTNQNLTCQINDNKAYVPVRNFINSRKHKTP